MTSQASDVNGLQLFVLDQKDFKPLVLHSALFECSASVISLAIDLLRCDSGFFALRVITRQIVNLSQDLPDLRNLKEAEIEPKVREYLTDIRRSFPRVLITTRYGMAGKNGRTHKVDCSGVFEPKAAAVIEINQMLMTRMANAWSDLKKSDPKPDSLCRFKTLHVRLAITMAHELVHIYILFLRRSRSKHTPTSMTYGPFGNERAGESGRYWESIVFGGYIDMRHTTGPFPAEAIAIRDRLGRYAWRLSPDAINGILGRGFGVWLEPGTGLNDPEHPKHRSATVKMDSLAWKSNFGDIFPAPSAQELQGPQELLLAQVAWLTGNGPTKHHKYSIRGLELGLFALDPKKATLRVQIA